MALIAPSILAADFARLAEALGIIKAAGATMVHVDVMDGHFVPDLTVGQPVIRSLRKATDLVLDVHLLIERPERYAAQFVEEGADRVALHFEATKQLGRALDSIRAQGAKAGVAVNVSTPIEALAEVLDEVDFLVILAAEPGIPEKAFLPRTLAKVQAAARGREVRRGEYVIEVEGGVRFDNFEEILRAGADILVTGSAIFSSENPKVRLEEMIRRAAAGRTVKV